MPIARVQMPDGRIGRFEVPEGTTPEQVTGYIGQMQAGESQPKGEETGVGMQRVMDALRGAGTGAAITATGKLISLAPWWPAKVVGGFLSAAPAMAMISGATSELARGEAERSGAGTGGQIAASLAGGLGPSAVMGVGKAGVRGAASLLGKQASTEAGSKANALAAKELKNALLRDKIDIAQLPVGKNIIQEAGPAITNKAEAIATRGGPASDKIVGYAEGRAAELPADLSTVFKSKFQEGNYPKVLEAIKTKAREEAAPAYEAAYKAATSINDDAINASLDKIVKAGDWKTLTSEAKKIAAYEGKELGNIDATGLLKSFSTKDLDYMTRALRNLGQATEGQGAMGAKTPIGGIRKKVAEEIRGRLKELNPAFKDATKNFADDVGVYEAAEAGKAANLMGSNWKTAVSEYSELPSELAKKAWRLGQAEKLHNMIARNPNAALRQFNSPQFKKVMKEFYPEDEYAGLVKSLTERSDEVKTLGRVTGNSRTAARALQQADDAASLGGDLVGMAANTASRSTAGNALASLKFLGNKVQSITNTKLRKEIDDLVTNALLSKPFGLASEEVSGGALSPVIKGITKLPKTRSQRFLESGKWLGKKETVPIINYLSNNGSVD